MRWRAPQPHPPRPSTVGRCACKKHRSFFFGGEDAERSSALSKRRQLQRPPQQPLQKPRQQLQARPLPLPLPHPHPNPHLDRSRSRSRSQATDRSALSARQPNWRSSRCSGYSLAPRPCVQVRRVWVGRALHRMDAVAELTWTYLQRALPTHTRRAPPRNTQPKALRFGFSFSFSFGSGFGPGPGLGRGSGPCPSLLNSLPPTPIKGKARKAESQAPQGFRRSTPEH